MVPNAPKRTFKNERFMARHMMTARMKPDEPSSAPATMSSLLSSANPMALADKPAYELSRAMDGRHIGAANGNDQGERRKSTKARARKGERSKCVAAIR